MKYLILAVLLSVVQAGPPSPRQASDHQGDSRESIAKDRETNQNPATYPKTVKVSVKSEPTENNSQDVGNNNATKSIRIGELPPVSVTRDWIDCTALFLTGILVVGGICGVVLANRTLNAIEKQVSATIAAERPWLVIRPVPFSLDNRERIDWTIRNTGRTTARIIEAQFRCRKYTPTDKLPEVPDYFSPINFFEIPVAPGGSEDAWCYMEPSERTYQGLSTDEIAFVRNTIHELIAYGFVKYLDTFGDKIHESRFCYYYALFCDDFRPNLRAPAAYHKCT